MAAIEEHDSRCNIWEERANGHVQGERQRLCHLQQTTAFNDAGGARLLLSSVWQVRHAAIDGHMHPTALDIWLWSMQLVRRDEALCRRQKWG